MSVYQFQSAPADGRRENPPCARYTTQPAFVSIRSRRRSAGEWPRPTATVHWRLPFQSAPADGRRENRSTPHPLNTVWQFQSAPADGRRENPRAAGGHRARRVRFNPLPPTVGGRILTLEDLAAMTLMFQSAPADGRRENRRSGLLHLRSRLVSIRSRRRSAGESAVWRAPGWCSSSFNPLPPTVGGRIRTPGRH